MKKTILIFSTIFVLTGPTIAQGELQKQRPELIVNNGLTGPLKYFAVNLYGDVVATLSETGLVQAWDVALRVPIMSNQTIGSAWGLAISPEGDYVAVLRPDGLLLHKDTLYKHYLEIPAMYRSSQDSFVLLQKLFIDIYSTRSGLRPVRSIDITQHLFNQGNWAYNRLFEYGVLSFEDTNLRFTGETEVEYIDLMCAYQYNFKSDAFTLNIQPWYETDKIPLQGFANDTSTWDRLYMVPLQREKGEPRKHVYRHLYSANGRFAALTFNTLSDYSNQDIEIWDIVERKKVTVLSKDILPAKGEFYNLLSIDNNGRYLVYKVKENENVKFDTSGIEFSDLFTHPEKFKKKFAEMQDFVKILVLDLETKETINPASYLRFSDIKAGLDGGHFEICGQLLAGIESSDKKSINNLPNIIALSGKPEKSKILNSVHWHNYRSGQTDNFQYLGGEVKMVFYNDSTQTLWLMEKSDVIRIYVGEKFVESPFRQIQPSVLSVGINKEYLYVSATDGFSTIHLPTAQIVENEALIDVVTAIYSSDGLQKIAGCKDSLIVFEPEITINQSSSHIISKVAYNSSSESFFMVESGESGLSDGTCRLYEFKNGQKVPVRINLNPKYCISRKILSTMGGSESEINWVEFCSRQLNDTTFQANGLAISADGQWLAINTTADMKGGMMALMTIIISQNEEKLLDFIRPGSMFIFQRQGKNWVQKWVFEPNMMSYDFTNEVSIAFSADGRYIAMSNENDVIKVWNLLTGMQIKQYRLDLEQGYVFSSKLKDLNTSPEMPIKAAKGRKENDLIRGLTFSSDISKLAFAAKDLGVVIRFNPEDDNDFYAPIISNYFAKKGYITCQSFNDNGTMIISGTSEGTIEFWGKTSNKSIAKIIARPSSEALVIVDSNGYYMANKRSTTNCFFKEGGRLYSIGSDNEYLNRPDTVLRSLWPIYTSEKVLPDTAIVTAYKQLYSTRVKGRFYLEKPEIYLENKRTLLQKRWDKALFRCSFTGNGIVDKIYVKTNGIPVWGSDGKKLTEAESNYGTTDFFINLLPGNNYIEISCISKQGVESSREQLILTGENDPEISKPNLYLITICTDHYKEKGLRDLKYSLKDGVDFISLFENNSSFYDKIYTEKLFNVNVDNSILQRLKSKLQEARLQDHVIVFLSGHGLLDNNALFWFPLTHTNSDSLSTTALSYQQLSWLFEGLSARRKAMFIDACHSGQVFKSWIGNTDSKKDTSGRKGRKNNKKGKPESIPTDDVPISATALMEDYFTELSNNTGTLVLAATTGDSYAQENKTWSNGVFTLALIKALKESPGKTDANNDGFISMYEWFTASRNIVHKLTGGAQNPSIKQDNPWADFRIR